MIQPDAAGAILAANSIAAVSEAADQTISAAWKGANRRRVGGDLPENFNVLGGATAGFLRLVLVAHILDTVEAGAGSGPASRIAEVGLLLVTRRSAEGHVADNVCRMTETDVHRERVRKW